MLLTILGNIVTAWSWFGTNMMGVGLHSYGFMESGVFWLSIAVYAHLLIVGIGLLPLALARSTQLPTGRVADRAGGFPVVKAAARGVLARLKICCDSS